MFDVKIDPEPSGSDAYMVVDESGRVVRAYGSHAAAWDHAIWSEYRKAGVIPIVGPGGWFKAEGTGRQAGWTSDPRQALTTSTYTAEDAHLAGKAVARFIRAMVSDEPVDSFLPDPEPSELPGMWEQADFTGGVDSHTPSQTPESPTESLIEPGGGGSPRYEDEVAYGALSDSEQRAYENLAFMSENAVTETARAWWTTRLVERFGDVAQGE